MEARIIRDCDMFGRVITFWKTNSADIPAGSKGATYSANLASDNKKLVDAGATQKGGKVTAQNALLLTLDTDLQGIARTAHAIAQDVPGFDDRFCAAGALQSGRGAGDGQRLSRATGRGSVR